MDEATDRPFDASVNLMAEAPASMPNTWSTISLAKYLSDALLAPPSRRKGLPQSGEKITEALRALTDRGLDGYAYVRYGLGTELAERIAGLASLPQLFSLMKPDGASEGIDKILGSLPAEVIAWSHLCESDITTIFSGKHESPDSPGVLLNSVMELTHDWHSRVQSWIQQADIRDLISWECPTGDDFTSLVESATPESDLETHYTWIVDRLTQTYLNDWKDSSLHHEYRWIKAVAPAPFPGEIMNLRPISLEALNGEIAERAVMGNGDQALRETVTQLAFQGSELVKSGNRDAAASTFRLITKISPGDVNARNNLGFSLVPDEPRKALRHLSVAARMGYDQPFINAHNRMICNVLIGAPKEALQIAEATWSSAVREHPIPAVLWVSSEGQWIVHGVPDARAEVANLALQTARALGEADQETWASRLTLLGTGATEPEIGHL
ncbi:hypothetical protein YUYDRAFT_03682 [Streptomyces sp. ScaeMP-e48]|uniref:tetratricopeptide repeat protein n=1 Tax=Streptomyces TaxID=1883 RepID=UPI000823C0B5|nr:MULTISPECIES: hypothetical protein [Streptomyces]WSA61755.1 hypothetical protein OHB31_16990 [Streptomyces microflavus]SCK31770.1 hypothetical protein YUYDRAFT_03682 [Streptomyces sp. ScaeMP-e48]